MLGVERELMQEVSDPITLSPQTDVATDGAGHTDGRSAVSQILAQQAAIAEIGLYALDHDSLDELFAEACSLVSRVLETELVSLLQIAADRQTLKVVAGVGWNPGTVGVLEVGMSTDSQSGYTIATR